MTLKGKVAWVTGGGSGIGLAGALEMAKAGARVVISGREAPKLADAIRQAEQRGAPAGSITAEPLDVSERAAVTRVADKIQSELQRVDILVNSAGVNFPKRFWTETDSETFEKVVAINLNGATFCTLAVLKGMQARREGTVINVASFAGWYPSYLTGPGYIASKAGLMALSASFNIEEGVKVLRATALCPGEVATPILKKRPVEPSAEDKARMLQEDDMGKTILFIAAMPPHVCINELVITPVWNRIYLGGAEIVRK